MEQRLAFITQSEKNLSGQTFNRCLDFGCGVGRFQYYLSRKCKEVYAVDVIPSCIELLKLKCPSTKSFLIDPPPFKYPVNFPYVDEELNQPFESAPLPFEDGTFDFIWSVTALQHIVHTNYFNFMTKELNRVASEKAIFLLIENHHDQAGHVKARNPQEYADALGMEILKSYPISVEKQDSHWVIHGIKPCTATNAQDC